MLFYTVLVLSYTLNGDYLQAKVIFPSARACGDALQNITIMCMP